MAQEVVGGGSGNGHRRREQRKGRDYRPAAVPAPGSAPPAFSSSTPRVDGRPIDGLQVAQPSQVAAAGLEPAEQQRRRVHRHRQRAGHQQQAGHRIQRVQAAVGGAPRSQRSHVQQLQHVQVQQVEEHRRRSDVGQRAQGAGHWRPFVQAQQQQAHAQGQQQELQ
ncbi:hypothetical protein G6F68_014301 [Rhizopus microsporus]|nr:hypothetical protein G6F68_014301 [Rhizopus microsporus]